MKNKISRAERRMNKSKDARAVFAKKRDAHNPHGANSLVDVKATVERMTKVLSRHPFTIMALAYQAAFEPALRKTFPEGVFAECFGRYGVGDYVTRDGTDVHQCISMAHDGDITATFRCVVAPTRGWCEVGEETTNLCRRYDPVNYDPAEAA
ncbi:hypothetical protein HFN60_30290 [Rhizobium leguminosarum]|uniref:hypothetical protein n=1 Tax=Rhizobium leguminosarum TaxID=384 RepID=UPI001C945971|nr:hypothetical protein [Rhizobium leguminosarum]MBY5819884.1 hypothetical protein [Rhizobium leguminosarum]